LGNVTIKLKITKVASIYLAKWKEIAELTLPGINYYGIWRKQVVLTVF
jgi:hypothetical protein